MTKPARGVFHPVRTELDFPQDEAKVLAFWKQNGIFEKTLQAETRATGPSQGTFVFYEGPPTANGMPHNGHVLTRAVKDVFPRYKTMQGYDVPRKAGWDTHGLPVEVEVEKQLGIHGKADIEKYGIEPFTHRCIESVFRYTEAWESLTEKIGFWVDLESAYVTYHKSYIESTWWALSELFKKGLLYKGHKVVWWWAQGGTALSSAEVGLGYKTVDDPSVFVAFPLAEDPETSLLVWTTTPWTLPSNMYAAVNTSFEYAKVRTASGKQIVLAKDLVPAVAKKLAEDLEILETFPGSALVGKKYVAPFDIYAAQSAQHAELHAVIAADFVLLDASGIVHIAPAFGEDDFGAHQKLLKQNPALPLFNAVASDGTFTADLPRYQGRWVKEADKDIIHELKERGRLVHHEVYRHEYPFCWRSDQDPLIQYARPAWYIRTTREIGRAIENNAEINWLPDHIKTGRFGDFLRNNVDWALSRERYWGTPLNIWVNDETGNLAAPASVAEILQKNPAAFDAFHEAKKKNPALSEHLLVHKPWIDLVTWQEPGEPGTYRRVPDVIDCWFDSGCMPFAQWGYPHAEGSKALFEKAFPADFISEAIDQTRGWFYSLLMISTLVFDSETQKKMGLAFERKFPHPYKACIVLGHVGDREGKKESKSKGNYTPPEVIFDRVRMEFAALDVDTTKITVKRRGLAYIALDDFDGLDLTPKKDALGGDFSGAFVDVYREGNTPMSLFLVPTKHLPRRVLAMSKEDLAALELVPHPAAIKTPVQDVPRLGPSERVFVEDPSAPAPGADAFRWFFYASSPSWTNTRHSLGNVRLEQKELQVKLRNVYSFFTIYANIDGFDPAAGNPGATDVSDATLEKSKGFRPVAERSELDRWILGELALTTEKTTAALDGYSLYDAARALVDFTESLSNWYVRRSRARFWSAGHFDDGTASTDKADAYFTLYTCLVRVALLAAPFVPFFADELYQNLVRRPWPESQPESVHLVRYPSVDAARIDRGLAAAMQAVRDAVSLGQKVRGAQKVRVSQPLSKADIVVATAEMADALKSHEASIREELNVEELSVMLAGQEGDLVSYAMKPNFRTLGPKIGKKVQALKEALGKADAGKLFAELELSGKVDFAFADERIELTKEDVDITVHAREGYAAATGRLGVVVLAMELTPALLDKGLARQVLRTIQGIRKDRNCDYLARLKVFVGGSERVRRVTEANRDFIVQEALIDDLVVGENSPLADPVRDIVVDGEPLLLAVDVLG